MDNEKQFAVPGRRCCLRAGLGLGGALALGWGRFGTPQAGAAALEQWLRGAGGARLGDGSALRRLGALYLLDRPQDRDPDRLLALLAPRGRSPRAVAATLRARIARDWRTADLALVDGWVLARTEARICALLRLFGPAAA